jgi:molybdopterin converting factor small subunit
MTQIRISSLLQEHADLPAVLIVTGDTVGDCLTDLIRQYPDAKSWLFSEDGLMRVIISINNAEIVTPDAKGVSRKLKPGDEIRIIAIVSGG